MDNLTKKIILGVLSVFMFFRTEAMEVAGPSGETWAEPSSYGRYAQTMPEPGVKVIYSYGTNYFTVKCGNNRITAQSIDVPASIISPELAKLGARLRISINRILGIGTEHDLTTINAHENPVGYQNALTYNFSKVSDALYEAFEYPGGVSFGSYYSVEQLNNDQAN